MKKQPKLLIAVGGTGGHLFPAQTLARDLLSQNSEIELLFAGAGLSSNRYFHKEQFSYQDVSSATPFRGNIFSAAKQLFTGVRRGLKLLDEFQPDLLIGFGSFHTVPLLAGAVLKKIPFLLFESNAIPGKVNRLFSRWAEMTAVQFSQAGVLLKGEMKEVAMPLTRMLIPKGEACHYYGLSPDQPIILVFGGSQGARSINRVFLDAVALLPPDFQFLHFTGRSEDVEQMRRSYAQLGRRACVKEFEERMAYAYSAADIAICRAGAVTVAELIAYELPAILIPYPLATDDHQRKNGDVMELEVGGARLLCERELNPRRLSALLNEMLAPGKREEMQSALRAFREKGEKETLSQIIWRKLHG